MSDDRGVYFFMGVFNLKFIKLFSIDNVKNSSYIYSMNETIQPLPLKVDRTKLITQAEYARQKKVSRQRIGAMIKANQLNTVEILGTILILMD